MIILQKNPPNYEEIKKTFKLKRGTIFAFGDTIYNPDGVSITPDLLTHELIHSKQQKDYGLGKWWNRYLDQPVFRASQEIPAFQAQYLYFKNVVKDRNRLHRILVELSKDLSAELYGNCMTYQEAFNVIKSGKKIEFTV